MHRNLCHHSQGQTVTRSAVMRYIISLNLVGGSSVYLNLTEENFVPDAVAANDPTADFSTFSLRSEVEQPSLQRAVSLAEDLQERQRQNTHLVIWYRLIPAVVHLFI